MLWTDEDRSWEDREEEEGYEPPPDSLVEHDDYWYERDPSIRRMRHRETPRLHLEDVARQHDWIDGLRTLSGELCDHGPIEVLDGEIVPRGPMRGSCAQPGTRPQRSLSRCRPPPSSRTTAAPCPGATL